MILTSSKNWKTVRLGEIAIFNYGKGLVQKTRVKGENPVYGSSGITGNHNEALVNEKGYIIGRKGSVGTVYYSEKPFWPIDTVYYVTEKDLKCDFDFFYYLLQTLGLNKMSFDSAVPGLNREMAYSLEVSIPDNIEEQREIAAILSSLDDKIELLKKENKTLENMAQALFKEWFVNFRFPGATGKMVDSELGMIPEGWMVGKLGDILKLPSGFSFKSGTFSPDGKYRLVTITNVKDGYFDGNTKDGLDDLPKNMPQHCLLKTGDVLMSLTGDVGRVCIVVGDEYILNQRVSKAVPICERDRSFVYFLLRSKDVFDQLQSITVGAVQQNLSPVKSLEIEMVVPDEKSLAMFSEAANQMFQKLIANIIEIQTLSEMRDELLNNLFNVN